MSTAPVMKDDKLVVPPVVEAPVSPNEETDKRVSEVLNERKKKKHPVEARIGQLTAITHDLKGQLEAQDKKHKQELEQVKKDAVEAEAKRQREEELKVDVRPARKDFPEGQEGESDFTAKMAQWVVRQQEKIVARTPVTTTAPDKQIVAPTLDPAIVARAKAEFDAFQAEGSEFMKRNPDFNDVLNEAGKRGLTMSEQARFAVIRLKAADVAYFLARPENEGAARKLMQMDDFQQALEVARLKQELTVNPQDFIPHAGNPGVRPNGSARADVRPAAEEMDTDDYIRQRRKDIKAGLRRR